MKTFTMLQEKSATRDEHVLLAATVIAAMSYQAAINPPGGVAGLDATEFSAPDPLQQTFYIQPGNSILAYFYSSLSNTFWTSNTISFMAALSVIFLYVTGATLKRKLFIWLIRGAMWITLTAMSVAYFCAVLATTPSFYSTDYTFNAIFYGLCTWIGLIVLSSFAVTYRAIRYVLRRIKKGSDARKKRCVLRRIKKKSDARKKIYTREDLPPITNQRTHIISFNFQT